MEVIQACELFVDKDDDLVFDHTKVILRRTNDGQYFFTRSPKRIPSDSTVTLEQLAGLQLTAIHPDHAWPLYNPKLAKAPHPLPGNSFIKRPRLMDFSDTTASRRLRELVLSEAEVCELLAKHPHPNVAQYLGCVVEGDRINGLCFARYHMTLTSKVSSGASFDRDACLRGIEDGIDHLHRLGLVHNDLNPSNIMMDDDGSNPVIIDFDSCKHEGQELGLKGGTFGWAAEDITHANRENDFYGLSKIREFLAERDCTARNDP